MTDLIDRQAAIDAIADYLSKTTYTSAISFLNTGALILAKVPSAQSEIIRCRDCKNWDKTWTNDWSPEYHYCPMIDGVRKGDFYCADAERRTDERSD